MTALDRYVRLEAAGIWREDRDAVPREVVVSFGNATLVLKDLADAPLGHWALAGVTVLRRDGDATVYAITADGAETLEIRDPEMTAAIAAVSRRPARRRRRRRLPLTTLFVLAALAGVAWAAPRVLHPDPALLVPPERAAELGDRIAALLAARHGAPCAGAAGIAALDRLAVRLAPDAPPRLRLAELGGIPAAALPGGTVLLDRTLAAGAPEALAGWAALGLGRDPAATLLRAAGPLAELRYLVTGSFPDAALARAADAVLAPPAAAEAVPALARLAASGLDPAPFAAALAAAGLPAAPVPPAGGAAIPARDRAALRDACRAG